jgi:hypothetical protein
MKPIMNTILGFVLLSSIALAQGARTIRVKIAADSWTRVTLLKQLNDHGASKHWKFAAASEGEPYDYLIQFQASEEDIPVGTYGGSIRAHDTAVTVYDADNQEAFSFTKPGRWTEKGAADSAAREIIKRLAVIIGK